MSDVLYWPWETDEETYRRVVSVVLTPYGKKVLARAIEMKRIQVTSGSLDATRFRFRYDVLRAVFRSEIAAGLMSQCIEPNSIEAHWQ